MFLSVSTRRYNARFENRFQNIKVLRVMPHTSRTIARVDSEKSESLKFEFFGLAHSLTTQLKYKNVNGFVSIVV